MDINASNAGGYAASALVAYAVAQELIEPADRFWSYNAVLEAIGEDGPAPQFAAFSEKSVDLQSALDDLAAVARRNGVIGRDDDGDMLSAHLMGLLMPRPSVVAHRFNALLKDDPQTATAYFYRLSADANYIRRRAIERDIKWTTDTGWGPLEITINRSKPEKDPRDIARAAQLADVPVEAYPTCQLCMENEGYAGRALESQRGTHPARQNLRIVPIRLGGQRWGLQYSPYAYYTEHCIAMSEHHVPMHIDRSCFERLLDFVDLLPHYFIGSNADLPIVGGSILSHDHFQGGGHVFPMDRAPIEKPFELMGYSQVEAGIVRWPLSVIRLASADRIALADAAERILRVWWEHTDESVGIVARSEGLRHNTITPIVRKKDGVYRMDLALRCNVTSAEHPLGVFHPHEELHHIKKENIGLIEAMGLAILPPRLARELAVLARALVDGSDLAADPLTAPHAVWARDVASRHPELSEFNVYDILHDEVGQVFAQVLEQAGVFKWDSAGRAALGRFLEKL